MNFDLVSKCAPKEFLCPYCGNWHPWTGNRLNQHYIWQYDRSRNVEKCPNVAQSNAYFWMEETDKKIVISIKSPCDRISSYDSITKETPMREFIEDEKEPIVYIYFTFTAAMEINDARCSYCRSYSSKACQYRKMGTDYRRIFPVKLGFKFSEEDYKKYSDVGKAGKFVESQSALLERTKKALEGKNEDIKSLEKKSDKAEKRVKELESLVNSLKVQDGEKDEKIKNLQSELVIAKSDLNEAQAELQQIKDQIHQQEEAIKMAETNNKLSGVWKQLYEHAPKENVDIAKAYFEKYKPTIKWAVPILGLCAASWILTNKNSPVNISNINSVCKDKLGFEMEALKDRKTLNKLKATGTSLALAFATNKLVNKIFTNPADISAEDVEEGLEKLDKDKEKKSWINPLINSYLPAALSVITVYLMVVKPEWFENFKEKASGFVCNAFGGFADTISVYFDMAKLYMSDKLNIDLDDDKVKQNAVRFACLALIVVAGIWIYGKKVLGKKAADEPDEEEGTEDSGKQDDLSGLKVFMAQLLDILKKMLPSAFTVATAYLVSKNIMKNDEMVNDVELNPDCTDGDKTDVHEESVSEPNDTTLAPKDVPDKGTTEGTSSEQEAQEPKPKKKTTTRRTKKPMTTE